MFLDTKRNSRRWETARKNSTLYSTWHLLSWLQPLQPCRGYWRETIQLVKSFSHSCYLTRCPLICLHPPVRIFSLIWLVVLVNFCSLVISPVVYLSHIPTVMLVKNVFCHSFFSLQLQQHCHMFSSENVHPNFIVTPISRRIASMTSFRSLLSEKWCRCMSCCFSGDGPRWGDPGGSAGDERGAGVWAAAEVRCQRRGVRPTQCLPLLPQKGSPAG